MKPGDELNFWVRHVIETRGAWHLRSPALNVPLYQRLYLDLVALVIVIICIMYYLCKKILYNIKKTIVKDKLS